jgi:hypothetical protein
MSSKRKIIKADLVAALATIPEIGEVTGEWRRVTEVDASSMPFIMVISSEEKRELVNSQRDTGCEWMLDVWCYLRPTDDLEDWIELVRAKICEDRSRGTTDSSPNALDTFVESILTDDQGLAMPNKFFLMRTRIDYRVSE